MANDIDISHERQRVLEAIDSAFGSLVCPALDEVYNAGSFEGIRAAEAFHQRECQKFTLDFLLPDFQDSLSFLTPRGYEYYLPKYTRVSVIHLLDADTVLENTVNSLDPPYPEFYDECANLMDHPDLLKAVREEGLPGLPMTGDEIRSLRGTDFEATKRWFLSHPAALTAHEKRTVLTFIEFLQHVGYFSHDDGQYRRMIAYYRDGRLPWG